MNKLKEVYRGLSTEKRARVKIAGGIIVSILLVLIIVLVMLIDNTPKYINTKPDNTQEIEDYISLAEVVAPINSEISEIRVVSNEDNEQADIMLGTVGLDINELTSYAASIDVKHDSSHAIVVTKPKPGSYALCKKALIDYVADKQRVLLESNKGDTQEYNNALSAVVYEHDNYLILVMEDNANTIVDEIVLQLDNRE